MNKAPGQEQLAFSGFAAQGRRAVKDGKTGLLRISVKSDYAQNQKPGLACFSEPGFRECQRALQRKDQWGNFQARMSDNTRTVLPEKAFQM